MPLYLALASVSALLAVSVYAVIDRQSHHIGRNVYRLCIGLCGVLFLAAVMPRGANVISCALPLGLPWIGMHFRLDVLSAFFLAVVNLGGAAASAYAVGYGAHEKDPMRVLPFYPAFLAGMNVVVLADDAFTFLVGWEFMSLASWALVLTHHHDEENRRAGFVYLLMASFGGFALLLAFGLLGGAGGAYDFAAIRESNKEAWKAGLVLALAMVGMGSKAGLAPLHIWLPLAHPAAPSHVSALMSGVMTKVAVYGFIRVVFDVLGTPSFWWSVEPMIFGAASALVGVLFASVQSDLKKLLAYSTIENVGIIFIALGLALAFKANGLALPAALAFTAALFHVFNHSLFKSLLFFGAGAVLNASGERSIERLGGLIHAMPKTAFLFLGGCVAISALPPLNGFVSEWLVFQAVLLSPSLPQWTVKLLVSAVGVALALSAALGAACYIRAYGVAFLGRPRSEAARVAQDPDRWSLGTMAVLLTLCLMAVSCRVFSSTRFRRRRRTLSAPVCPRSRNSPGSRSRRSPKAAAPTMASWSLSLFSSRPMRPDGSFIDLVRRGRDARRHGTAATSKRAPLRNTPAAASRSRSDARSELSPFRRGSAWTCQRPATRVRRA